MKRRMFRFVAPVVMLLGAGVTMFGPTTASAQWDHDGECARYCHRQYRRCIRWADERHERRYCNREWRDCMRECDRDWDDDWDDD